jgi:hypothetical protein
MVKVVIDANILISAALTPGSIPAEVIDLVKQNKITWLTSQAILEEMREVLLYPKIKKRLNLTNQEADEFISEISKLALITPGFLSVTLIKADPRDDKYLACALEGRADYIVSGDKHLLNLKAYRRINTRPRPTSCS